MIFDNPKPSSKVLLVNAKTLALDTAKDSPALPLPLLCAVNLAASKFEIEIFDERLGPLTDRHLDRWQSEGLLCVGVTGLTGPEIGFANAIVARLRKRIDAPIIWGGKHATLFSDHLIENRRVDIAVVGEGEQTFVDLCRAFQNRTPLKKVPGLVFRDPESGQLIRTVPAPLLDLDSLPALAYHILNHDYLFLNRGKKTTIVESSRGCPYQCKYCYHSRNEAGRWRAGGTNWFVQRLLALQERFPDARHVNIQDDNFFVSKKRCSAIASAMIEHRIDLTYTASGGIRDILRYSGEDLAGLKKSGLARVDIGLETMSPRQQEMIDKHQTPEQVLQVYRLLDRHGIQAWGNIMVGFPGEGPKDRDQTLALIKTLTREFPQVAFSPFYIYTPYPKTALYEQLKSQGVRLPSINELEQTSWGVPIAPWHSRRERKFLERLYFYSLFIDDKVLYFRKSPLVKLLHRIIKPIARFRVFHHFMRFPVEKWLFDLLFRMPY